MNIMVSISLATGETAPTKSAKELLTEFGGDPDKDTLSLSISESYAPPPVSTTPAGAVPN